MNPIFKRTPVSIAVYAAIVAAGAATESHANLLANGSFESPVVAAFQRNPSNPGGWTFNASSGVMKASNSVAFNNPASNPAAAPNVTHSNYDGNQYAILQSSSTIPGNVTPVISQSFTASDAGHYRITWLDAGRYQWLASDGTNPIPDGEQEYDVKVDSSVVSHQTVHSATNNATATFQAKSAIFDIATTGSKTLSFVATTNNTQNHTAYLDKVNLDLYYRYASGKVTTDGIASTSKNFGNVRIGTATAQALTIVNTAANDGKSEKLDATFSPAVAGDATKSGGPVNLLAAGASDNSSMFVGIDTGTAGAKNGTVTVNLTSNGQTTGTPGNSGLGATVLDPQSISVSGNVIRLAEGQATPAPVDFTSTHLHVGDTATQTLTIVNTAANDGFSERLGASFAGQTGNAGHNGGVIGNAHGNLIAAGASNNTTMSVSLDTSAAGARNGTVTIQYSSDGIGIDSIGSNAIDNGTQIVQVKGDVYNYADADFVKAGGAGTLTGDGTPNNYKTDSLVYNLDLGTLTDDNSSVLTANLTLLNNAFVSAFTDNMFGSFDLSHLNGFTVGGGFASTSFSNVAGGSSINNLLVSLNTALLNAGTYNGYILLAWHGENASGYVGADQTIRLNLTGVIQERATNGVPEPGILSLLGSAGLGFGWVARRRRETAARK